MTIILVFGLAFLIVKLVDVTISSSDVFGWITTIDNNCNISNETGVIISKDPLTWVFFIISLLITAVFSIMFCCSCVCSLHSIHKYENEDVLKILLEISIIAAFFDPVSNVKLLLRDCLAGYLMVGTVAAIYCLTVFAVTIAIVNSECLITFFITICQIVQVVACLFAFGMFFGFAMKMDNSYVKYGYLAVTIVVSVFVWIKNTMERFFFRLFFVRNDVKFCYLPNNILAIVSYSILIYLTATYFMSNKGTLHIISLIFFAISAGINVLQVCICLHHQTSGYFPVYNKDDDLDGLLRSGDDIDDDTL